MFFGSKTANIMLNQHSYLYIYFFLLIGRSNKFAIIIKKQMNNKLIFNYAIFEFS